MTLEVSGLGRGGAKRLVRRRGMNRVAGEKGWTVQGRAKGGGGGRGGGWAAV